MGGKAGLFLHPLTSTFIKHLLRPPKGQDLQRAELRMGRVSHYHNGSNLDQGALDRESQHSNSKAFFLDLLQKNRYLDRRQPQPFDKAALL